MKIEKIELFVIVPEDKHYSWSEDIPEVFQSNTILRIYTDNNVIGEAGVWNAANFDYDKYTAESLKHLLPILIGQDPLDKEKILQQAKLSLLSCLQLDFPPVLYYPRELQTAG